MSDLLKITFLGTSAAVPTKHRGLPSVALVRESDIFLLDCGEGTQRQIMLAGIPPSKISTVFISHLHGDHFLGLPGFISTQQLMGRKKPLLIVAPDGTKEFMTSILRVTSHQLDFELKYLEIDPTVSGQFMIGAFTVYTSPLEHRSPNIGYRFVEKEKWGFFNVEKAEKLGVPDGPLRKELVEGRPITVNNVEIRPQEIVGPPVPGRIVVYCTDTRPCQAASQLAHNADVLIFDSTFEDKDQQRAQVTFHSTSRQAAVLAREAHVKKLFLYHISSRNENGNELDFLHQAQEEFVESFIAFDFESVNIYRKAKVV